eukprot:355969-Chlamydomonas_euryale.AAC.6
MLDSTLNAGVRVRLLCGPLRPLRPDKPGLPRRGAHPKERHADAERGKGATRSDAERPGFTN